MMKVSCSTVVASLLAASTAALSTSHSNPNAQELRGRRIEESSLEKEKFAPRFDGLRFIETLVTAHR
ncbi:hypothetical protein L6452_25426 [Arctium lappa]|uniref:Uncharacterized protein n=1 Tax=Arctium lappa TaxID=4217 RepID=A0ACB9AAA1_ARCLA|nr:hypothetical protein L6452_25426 [Arctium lappa]